jgi:hypothetical protein
MRAHLAYLSLQLDSNKTRYIRTRVRHKSSQEGTLRNQAIGLVVSVVGVLVFASSASAAALPGVVSVTGKPGPLPSCPAAEADGFNSRPAAQVTTFSDGGKLYTYEEEGEKIVLPQPPANFNPLKASEAELERYAFPKRPSSEEQVQLAKWEEEMGTYKEMAPPTACTGAPPPRSGISGRVRHTGTSGSYNWSGYVTNAPTNRYQWNAAEGDFYQVNGAAHTSCKSNAILSSWVGLGGFEPEVYGGFIQDGTDAYTNGSTDVWYEMYSGLKNKNGYFPEMYVNPGDYIGFLVEYSTSTSTASFITYDQNTGVYRSVVIPETGIGYYDGSSGDFIEERPGVAGTENYYPLLNFGTSQFYYAEVRTAAGNWTFLGETNNVKNQMWSGGGIEKGKKLASPGITTETNGYVNVYYNCQ